MDRVYQILSSISKLGPNDPQTLSSMNNLALSYGLVKRFEKALVLQKEAYERLKAVLPPIPIRSGAWATWQ